MGKTKMTIDVFKEKVGLLSPAENVGSMNNYYNSICKEYISANSEIHEGEFLVLKDAGHSIELSGLHRKKNILFEVMHLGVSTGTNGDPYIVAYVRMCSVDSKDKTMGVKKCVIHGCEKPSVFSKYNS